MSLHASLLASLVATLLATSLADSLAAHLQLTCKFSPTFTCEFTFTSTCKCTCNIGSSPLQRMGALDQRFLVLVNAIIFGCPRLLPRLPTPFVDPIATVLVILFVAVAFLAQGAQIWFPPFVLRPLGFGILAYLALNGLSKCPSSMAYQRIILQSGSSSAVSFGLFLFH